MFRKKRKSNDFSAEVEAHLDLEAERLKEQGMSDEEARAAAHRAFGNVTRAQERFYESSRWVWWDQLGQDVRYGLRQLRRSPGFTLAAVLTLALGIGANSAIFSVADALIWKPLPIHQLDRVVMVMEARRENPSGWIPASPGNYLDWKAQNKVFEHLSAFLYVNINLSQGGPYEGDPQRLKGVQVPADFFETLEVTPLLGRTFAPDDEQPGHDQAVILSYPLWQRDFGAGPGILGKVVRLNGRDRTIVGIMPRTFRFPGDAELWVPLAMPAPLKHSRFAKALFGVARLKPGVSLPEARTQMRDIARRLAEQFPQSNAGWTTSVFPLRAFLSGDVPSYVILLMGVVLFVLLISCANVANLLLVRATRRSKEIALRVVLGASRGRVTRQLLAESLLVSLLGGTVGVLAAYWGVGLLRTGLGTGIAADIAGWENIQIDHRVLIFTLLIAILSGLISGLAPLSVSIRSNFFETLKAGEGMQMAGSRRQSLRGVLVVCEVALAVMLLAGATLMARGLFQLLHRGDVPVASQVLTLRISLPESKYRTDEQATDFFDRTLGQLESLPGVRSAALATALPDTGVGSIDFEPITLEGQSGARGQQPIAVVEAVSPDYFRTLQIPLRAGRAFGKQDGAETIKVATVSEYTAKQLWPGEDAIGKRLKLGNSSGSGTGFEVVGVADNVPQSALDREPRLTVYLPYPQWPERSMQAALRVSGNPLLLAPAARERVYQVDREQPVYAVATLQHLVEDETAGLRYVAIMMAVFGGLAVMLAAVGIYGVMSRIVSMRIREIGVRMALGAKPRDVMALVARQGLLLTTLGVAAGIVGALGVARLLAGLFYGVRPTDLFTYVAVGLMLIGVALIASYIPARRATKVDPLVALRYE
jgi:putative ABC transport system permease protein